MLLVLLAACLPPWHVTVQTNPSPLVGVERLDLAPIRYRDLHVGAETEAEYLQRMRPERQDAWRGDKAGLDEGYRASATARAGLCGLRLEPPGGPGKFTVAAEIDYIEPGFYAGVVSNPSAVHLAVRITTGGELVDEFFLTAGTSPSSMSVGPVGIPTAPTVTERLEQDGMALGELVGTYLCRRKAGK